MADPKWLADYSGQTTDELIALEGEYPIDPLVLAFEKALAQKAARVGLEGLTEEEHIVLAIAALESEVNNGGFQQLFTSPSRKYAPIMVDALKRIGCAEAAELAELAIYFLGIEGPLTVEAIDRVMGETNDTRGERLSECDEQFDEVAADLATPLFAFIKNNRGKIRITE